MEWLNTAWEWIVNFCNTFAHDIYRNFIADSRYLLVLDGLKITILISVCAILMGIVFGSVVTLLRRSRFRVPRAIGYVYVDVIRGTPMVTQLLVTYFVIFGSVHIDPVLIAIVAFGINSGAYVSEIIRAGILSIDKGQTEAGRSLGLSKTMTMTHIVLPQAVKNILPTLCNEFVVLIKETAVVGYLAIPDLTKAGDIIRSRTFDFDMPLVAVAIIYYIIIKFLTLAISALERRLRKSDLR